MKNPMDMSGKHIIVSGAGSGIGRATAILLAELGASLVLVGRDPGKLAATGTMLCHTNFVAEPFDFSQSEDIVEWLRGVAARKGKFDGLAHCAGIQTCTPLRTLTVKGVDRLLRINTVSAAMLIKAMQFRDCSQDRASIVMVASTAATKSTPNNGAYGASKAALLALVRTFAIELVERGVRLNAVVPAGVDTEMVESFRTLISDESFQRWIDGHPMGLGRPEDVANSIAFLLSDAARWITGSALAVDGGVTA